MVENMAPAVASSVLNPEWSEYQGVMYDEHFSSKEALCRFAPPRNFLGAHTSISHQPRYHLTFMDVSKGLARASLNLDAHDPTCQNCRRAILLAYRFHNGSDSREPRYDTPIRPCVRERITSACESSFFTNIRASYS